MLRSLIVTFVLSTSFIPIANAQPSVGGLPLETMDKLCNMGAMLGGGAKKYIDAVLQGRYAAGNSTTQQYKQQKNWMKSNCPVY